MWPAGTPSRGCEWLRLCLAELLITLPWPSAATVLLGSVAGPYAEWTRSAALDAPIDIALTSLAADVAATHEQFSSLDSQLSRIARLGEKPIAVKEWANDAPQSVRRALGGKGGES